jgi:hypothetical protein
MDYDDPPFFDRFIVGEEPMRITALMVLLGATAFAQPVRNRNEKAQDKREIVQDKRETRDDQLDAMKLQAVSQRFERAVAAHDLAALAAIDNEVRVLIAVEQRESAGEVRRDNGEIRRDNREVRSDRRETAGDAPGTARKADDRRDTRDDRRDRRDDVRDRNVEAAGMQRRAGIAAGWSAVAGKHDPDSLGKKRAMLAELNQMARNELRQDARETREDKRELREDRKETREDRRQRK